jgi:hypothetical protein
MFVCGDDDDDRWHGKKGLLTDIEIRERRGDIWLPPPSSGGSNWTGPLNERLKREQILGRELIGGGGTSWGWPYTAGPAVIEGMATSRVSHIRLIDADHVTTVPCDSPSGAWLVVVEHATSEEDVRIEGLDHSGEVIGAYRPNENPW